METLGSNTYAYALARIHRDAADRQLRSAQAAADQAFRKLRITAGSDLGAELDKADAYVKAVEDEATA
ncbi:hypothetical protein LCGC14_0789840 [marine sediment metagenome]|uniref:Uncharacterized protein n=1 Tax=marine sediment metagenome TaxID=412755 RepID=A0A0F9PX72_9ZZZZ